MDDNFIGNKRNAKLLLPQIRTWQEERGYPFSFSTEASVDLADDEEMMRMMHDARFESVFLGIETPDEASLERLARCRTRATHWMPQSNGLPPTESA